MLISLKNNFVFIHNYKVAGTSVYYALRPYSVADAPKKIEYIKLMEALGPKLCDLVNKVNLKIKFIDSFEPHVSALKVKKALGEEIYNKMFSFGFVRNPYDWQVSLYHYGKKQRKHHQYELMNSFSSFKEYIRWRVKCEVRLQKDFFCDLEGNKIVKYIGRFEDINSHIRNICDHIGIDVVVGHYNTTNHKTYDDYYDNETRGLVREVFKEDFEIFGYEY